MAVRSRSLREVCGRVTVLWVIGSSLARVAGKTQWIAVRDDRMSAVLGAVQ